MRRRRRHLRRQLEVPARRQGRLRPGLPLQDEDARHVVRRQPQRLVDERLVRHHAAGPLEPARREHHRLGLRVVDARGKLRGRKAAEDDGVHGAEARAREHSEDGFGDLRHVDNHAVAFAHAVRRQRPRRARHLVLQLRERDAALGAAVDGRIVDQRRARAVARLHVPVHGIVARVELAAGEPAVDWRGAGVEDPVERFAPADALGSFSPECFRLLDGAAPLRFVRFQGVGAGKRGGSAALKAAQASGPELSRAERTAEHHMTRVQETVLHRSRLDFI